MSSFNNNERSTPPPPSLPPPAPRSANSLLQRPTASSEGAFYRRSSGNAAATTTTTSSLSSLPSDQAHKRSFSAPVRPQAMADRTVNSAAAATTGGSAAAMAHQGAAVTAGAGVRAGSLRPPGELGVAAASHSSQPRQPPNRRPPVRAHPRTVRQRRNDRAARQRGHAREQAAVVGAAGGAPPSLCASFCYDGMEIVVAATGGRDRDGRSDNNRNSNNSNEDRVECYIILARTRLVLQRLALPTCGGSNSSRILALQAHAATGQIALALENGIVQTYAPVATDPRQVSAGRYRWWPGPRIRGAQIFYDDGTAPHFGRPATPSTDGNDIDGDDDSTNGEGAALDLSLTGDGRLLVAHRDQLVVFDCSAAPNTTTATTDDAVPADMLWTTQLPGHVVTAKISGDGQSIAVVLQGNGDDTDDDADDDDDKAARDGVHTFERDRDDGSQDFSADGGGSAAIRPPERPKLGRVPSLGILYKPGPFLVHSAPVTRLAFRGYGHVMSSASASSSSSSNHQQGNDLLLTYCADDCTARIFGQNHWHPLTEWTTPADTRVDWVKGIAVFTLGDLESVKKADKTSPFPPGADDNGSGDGDNIHATLGKRFHFSSIQSHHAPSTSAGAWVCEISFEDANYPALRLSRLTYLKRGVDDLNPTLLESVSSFLPANCVFRDRILTGTDDSGLLSIEGVWPAWNPFLSETTDLNTTETLKGSAMSFLGLSSGPAAGLGGGNFGGEGSLGGVQSPPSELRIVSSHAVSGQVTLLEFPLLADKAMTSLELGGPVRNVLAVSRLNAFVVTKNELAANSAEEATARIVPEKRIAPRAAVDYDSSRLVAELSGEDSRSLSITWRRPGTMSFLPHNWLPEDAKPEKAADLLRNFASTLRDESLIPVPLELPSIDIPVDPMENEETFVSGILWWPESKFGGTPLLVAVMSNGTVLVFEVAPPVGSSEPPLPPECDKPQPTTIEIKGGINRSPSFNFSGSDEGEINDDLEYEVSVTPDPEYGLGLRLESQVDGMCAIAGSYKRHPVTGEALPAEKGGAIQLGDELLKANDVDLEDKPFDDIIAAVREVGTKCGPGNPIRMRFRRSVANFERHNSILSSNSSRQNRSQSSRVNSTTPPSQSQRRRTMEQMLGVSPQDFAHAHHKRSETQISVLSMEERGSPRHGGGGNNTGIAGVFPNAVAVNELDSIDTESRIAIIPYEATEDTDDRDRPRTALLFSALDNTISVTLLSVTNDCNPEKSEYAESGKYDLPENSSSSPSRICALHVVKSSNDSYTIAACTDGKDVHLVSITVKPHNDLSEAELDFSSFSLFQLKAPWSPGCLLRLHSAELLATMQPDSEGLCNSITIWHANPQPGCSVDGSSGESSIVEYCSTEISTEYCLDGNRFLDFDFLCPGFLDATPSLCTFSFKGAGLFLKQGGNSDWMPAAQITYSTAPWSASGSSPVSLSGRTFHSIDDVPRDMFPHLIPGLASVYTSRDEELFLRSDWHPDSLLTHVCTDSRGAKIALKDRVRFMLLWLCSESRDIPEGHLDCPLAVAPMPILDQSNEEEEDTPEKPTDLMAALSTRTAVETIPENALIRDLQTVLRGCISGPSVDSGARKGTIEVEEKNSTDLPSILASMDADDLRLLWALGEVVVDPPRFEKIDVSGQLYLFAAALFRNILKVSRDDSKKPRLESMPEHSTMIKKTVNGNDAAPRSIASAGALAALLSTNQSQLRQISQGPEQKMTWSFAREHRIAFWIRSDAELARIAEEIGQTIFRQSRDIMECALFFIIAGKVKTLRNLAATDQSTSGKMFFKFITQHDFSGERGRRAAEKNAFSLLRKCRFRVASAFFLLASPPFLKSALETIATKMQDIDLAFLVGRLMESPKLRSGAESLFSSGGILGGGGGYASATPAMDVQADVSENELFSDWKPELGKESRKFLVERALPSFAKDSGMTALSLLWLEKKEEAAWFLSGSLEVTYAGVMSYRLVDDVTHRFFDTLSKLRRNSLVSNLLTRPVDKANMLVDFASSPILLKALNASSRVRFATSLRVSNALSARGVEVLSIRTLLQFADPDDLDEKADEVQQSEFEASSNPKAAAPIPQKANPQSSASNDMQSSIFDDFAPPPPSKAPASAGASNGGGREMQSSIFDDFAPPPPRRAAAPAPGSASNGGNGEMQSSIFDDFAPPPPRKTPPPAAPTINGSGGDMQSSIFDDFKAPSPPPKPKTTAPPANESGIMSSSIFDDFAAAPPVQKPKAPAPPLNTSGEMSSSIFDSFDAPLAQKPTIQSAPPSSRPQDATTSPAYNVEPPKDEAIEEVINVQLSIGKLPTPRLWVEWRKQILLDAAARRLLRETASVLAQFHGDPAEVPVHEFYGSSERLVSPGVSEVLQLPCDADSVLNRIRQSLQELSTAANLDEWSVAQRAMRFLGSSLKHRTLFSVVLNLAIGRANVAEDIVRSAAKSVIQKCDLFSVSTDELVLQKQSRSFVSSQFLRREVARVSWQLESCLWFHRGGGLPLSGHALNEAIIAVRIGLLLATWNRNFFCLESLIQSEPDCITDVDAGRPLWTSLRAIDLSKPGSKSKKTSSGGWEFLVECRRSQATELLRDRPTGCFIIRPHAEDHGVFTLSFKTNLIPAASEDNGRETEMRAPTPDTSGDELSDADVAAEERRSAKKKKVKKDDVVQHAIIRLSDSGFRCGSFGPFTSLITLLEAVSSSLPFKLRFDLPPRNRVIKEEGSQTSPNAVLLRKLTLRKATSLLAHPPTPWKDSAGGVDGKTFQSHADLESVHDEEIVSLTFFLELAVLSLIRRQLSSVAVVYYDESSRDEEEADLPPTEQDTTSFGGQSAEVADEFDNQFSVASRMLGPLLTWCRMMEVSAVGKLAPETEKLSKVSLIPQEIVTESSDNVTESPDAIEVAQVQGPKYANSGDSILRGMIQQGSGVEFSTLRLIDGGECTMVVLFSRKDAVKWLVSNGIEQSDEHAGSRLQQMELDRIIEPVDLGKLPLKQKGAETEDEEIRYRFVDPWEVEALQNREGETRSASLGRGQFVGFSLGQVETSLRESLRKLDDVPLLELWASAKGGIVLTKALASVFPPWERAASGDLQLTDGHVTEPSPFTNSIRESLYRNALYRRLNIPQRFVALVQVELLDLKNLTTPGGSLSMTAYALLRLKRAGSAATLTNKARTLDSASTTPMKLNKTSGPNAPASWGSVVRFRFPLPEDVAVDGTSYDRDRESLFKGPPCVLQVSVYEKKLLVDHSLGTADIRTDGLGAGGQLEEWVPLRSEKRGAITWFARVRLTLRFELMCVASKNSTSVPSVGLQRIEALCHSGGSVHEDIAQKRSMSSSDLMSYFENIV